MIFVAQKSFSRDDDHCLDVLVVQLEIETAVNFRGRKSACQNQPPEFDCGVKPLHEFVLDSAAVLSEQNPF